MTRASVAITAVSVDVGTMRQLTFAVAVCGSALYACPPESRVATHVVRSIDAYAGLRDSVAAATVSAGFATIARIADAISGAETAAVRSKYERVTSFNATGK